MDDHELEVLLDDLESDRVERKATLTDKEEMNLNTPVIAFFNSKGSVGKTSLVYHLAWMYADLGWKVIVADLDPQANLTATFLDEDRLEELWPDGNHPNTIFGSIQPIREGTGDIARPHIEEVDEGFLPQHSLEAP